MIPRSESTLVAFYRGAPDVEGRTLAEILQWEDDRLESTHDYIQWMFPLRDRSGANPVAPVLSDDDVRAFRGEPALRHRMLDALNRMQDFYRLGRRGERQWLTPGNHNYLRLTRMLRSLRTLGLPAEARQLFDELTAIYHEHSATIGPTTYRHWQQAMTDDLES